MVYVDELRDWGWRLGPSCHLLADTNEELHEFAARLGLERAWFHASASGPHYDLTKGKRALAVRLGAVEIDDRTMVAMLRRWRAHAVALITSAPNEAERTRRRAYLYR